MKREPRATVKLYASLCTCVDRISSALSRGNRKRDKAVGRIVNQISRKEHAEGCLVQQVHLRGLRRVM